jgi:phospholipid/cholesterol/gamma-HCH transport system substrate-binding protein
MRREVKIGFFMGGAFLIFVVLVFVIGNLSRLFQPRGYPLIVHFDSVLGLDESAAVRMVGIKVGYIKDIQLDLRRARVTLSIFPRYQVPRGSKAGQAAQGLLGEKYVEIQPGPETTYYQPGDELPAAATTGLDQLAPMLTSIGEEIKDFSQTLRSMLGEETKGGLHQTLQNLASLAAELNSLVAENKGRFGRVLDGADRAVTGLDGRLQEVTATIDQARTAPVSETTWSGFRGSSKSLTLRSRTCGPPWTRSAAARARWASSSTTPASTTRPKRRPPTSSGSPGRWPPCAGRWTSEANITPRADA